MLEENYTIQSDLKPKGSRFLFFIISDIKFMQCFFVEPYLSTVKYNRRNKYTVTYFQKVFGRMSTCMVTNYRTYP